MEVTLIPYQVRCIDNSGELINWMSMRHYSNTCPTNTKRAFGLFDAERMIGACLFGPPSRLNAGRRFKGCAELTRLFVEDGTPKNTESFFVGACLRHLRRERLWDGIVSYADPNVGHRGTIYQAANFKLVRQSSKSYHYVDDNGHRVHSARVWQRAQQNNLKEKTQASREGLTKVYDLPKLL